MAFRGTERQLNRTVAMSTSRPPRLRPRWVGGALALMGILALPQAAHAQYASMYEDWYEYPETRCESPTSSDTLQAYADRVQGAAGRWMSPGVSYVRAGSDGCLQVGVRVPGTRRFMRLLLRGVAVPRASVVLRRDVGTGSE